MDNNRPTGLKSRLEFIDALRGVCMIFVIYYHLIVYWGNGYSYINDFAERWRMPMFFFISGFIGYSATMNLDSLSQRLKNRLTRQLYPTVVIWLIFILFSFILSNEPFREHLLHGIYDPAKVGYWFTFSLVQVFILYSAITFMLVKKETTIRFQSKIYTVVLSVCLIAYVTYMALSPVFSGFVLKVWNVLSIEKTFPLISFFFAGVVCRVHEKGFFKLMGKWSFCFVNIVLYVVTIIVDNHISSAEICYLSKFLGLFAMVSLFVILRDCFNSTTIVGRYLIRVGRNTLPIYLFQFFVLIAVLNSGLDINGWMDRILENSVVELFVLTTASLMILEFTLLVDRTLRRSQVVYHLIFMIK